MDLQPIRYFESATADRPWLASRHGLDAPLTITLDTSLFAEGTHYMPPGLGRPHNVMHAGLPLGQIAATGLYGPWDSSATDSRAAFTGLLLTDVAFAPGSGRAAAALLWHGVVEAAQIPGGLDPAAATATSTAQIHFV
ncbi:head decoration protein [Streptomyces lonarensis]|uniref:Head decoration protein n=1 Tax=Streptomyces lonarensis TaxID=700599 RepID=A0A7X6CX32_9ACTN|nr:head decoration protein [Streptomyces lonarensis]NJQ04098.1 head decoration protein [Streptomyces lonarensis]